MSVKEQENVATAEKVFTLGEATAEDVKAAVEARVKRAVEEAMAMERPEVAEPYLWWNLYAFGPIQNFAPGQPLAPHQVIKIGEKAQITTVLVLNPLHIVPPGLSPLELLSDFGLPYEIRYQTGNLTNWMAGAPNATHNGNLIPGTGIYVDVLEFTAQQEGLMEMNITARILGVGGAEPAPHFAGFARWIGDFDPELFWPGPTPGYQFDLPVKFMVYP